MGLLDRFRKPQAPELPPEPAGCVAIILDGNGRWAMSRGLPVAEGHREGTRALRRTVEAAIDLEHRLARRLRLLDRELDSAVRTRSTR